MKVFRGSIFDCPNSNYIVIPTNLIVRKDGLAVMGAGLALQAAQLYPELPILLGKHLTRTKDTFPIWFKFKDKTIICFATKHDWKDKASISLIQDNIISLTTTVLLEDWKNIAIPKLGAGLGQLQWNTIKPIMEQLLDNNYILCLNENNA